MDIKQLAYFVAIANEKQITRAAQKLYITQPYLSRQLKEMEDELGVCLMDRSGPNIKLTEYGNLLLEKAQDILARMDDLKALVALDAAHLSGTLNIGTLISCSGILTPYVKSLSSRFPNLRFKIQEAPPQIMLERLKKHELELAFMHRTDFFNEEFSFIALKPEEYCLCVANERDPYPGQDSVSLRQVADLPLIMPYDGWIVGHNERIRKEFARINRPMNILCQCSNSSLIMALVSGGVGASILSHNFVVTYQGKQVACKKIQDCRQSATPIIVWDKTHYLSFFAKTLLQEAGVAL